MPQIWMTYDELATLCGCSPMEARDEVRYLSLPRRKCSDGATRVKLNAALSMKYFATIRETDFDLDGAIAALREMHRQMAEPLARGPASDGRGVA
ncbi:hypothetical protein JQ543_26605 [Bradyrhizobium diazoefficiens]|nr:hypothetical protein [Bradyrhizobium diazoefficiens]MBR0851344.1 hypothetical protein [Bradyrhizobium diazoefficiens]